jgi:hypothetical protein
MLSVKETAVEVLVEGSVVQKRVGDVVVEDRWYRRVFPLTRRLQDLALASLYARTIVQSSPHSWDVLPKTQIISDFAVQIQDVQSARSFLRLGQELVGTSNKRDGAKAV